MKEDIDGHQQMNSVPKCLIRVIALFDKKRK